MGRREKRQSKKVLVVIEREGWSEGCIGVYLSHKREVRLSEVVDGDHPRKSQTPQHF
jgi:hypothetical protein